MKVILNDHIENLGERGDSVVVKPGYARNYLLPKGLAYLDTPGNRKLFAQEQSRWEEMDLHRKSAAEKVAAEMEGTELTFERRAGEKDVLFGSVSIMDIARELAERGFELERRRVKLDSPIKELGTFPVEIQVHREISVTVPVHVIRPGGQPEPAEGEGSPIDVLEGEAPVEAAAEDAAPIPDEAVVSEPAGEPFDPDSAVG
jgi:large subunit ribosomal protein L9